MKKSVITFLTIALSTGFLYAEGKISGEVFADYYYVSQGTYARNNGFQFRRIYFTYDDDLDGNFSARLRIEARSTDFTEPPSRHDLFIKDAYFKWKVYRHDILLGISKTPTWNLVGANWGYRSVEKTPLHLLRFGSARDFGIAIKGAIGTDNKFGYHFMLGNGSGYKSETNKNKKVFLSVHARPSAAIFAEAYGDLEYGKDYTSVYTLQGHFFLNTRFAKLGLLAAQQTRQTGLDEAGAKREAEKFEICSVFASKTLIEKLAVFGRLDFMLDPNPVGDLIAYTPMQTDAKPMIVIMGVDYMVSGRVRLQPNVELISYSVEKGRAPDMDVYVKLTAFCLF